MTVVCDLISATSTEKHNNHKKPVGEGPKTLFRGIFAASQVQAPVFKLNTINNEQIKALVDLFHVIMRDVVRLDTNFEDHGSLLS